MSVTVTLTEMEARSLLNSVRLIEDIFRDVDIPDHGAYFARGQAPREIAAGKIASALERSELVAS